MKSNILQLISNLLENINRISQNKKLYSEYNTLQNILEAKTKELSSYRNQLDGYVEKNARLIEEKEHFEREVDNITYDQVEEIKENKYRTKLEFEKLLEENDYLARTCKEDEKIISNLEAEKAKYLSLVEDLKFENNSLQGKLSSREESLGYNQKLLEDSNRTIAKMNSVVKDLELKADKLSHEVDNLNTNNVIVAKNRLKSEKEFEAASQELKAKEAEIRKYLKELDNLSIQKDKLYEDNTKMYNEIEKLKNHIYAITEQNRKVMLYSKILAS